MQTRTFTPTGKPVSLLGFGMMRLPVLVEGEPAIDYDAAMEMVDFAMGSGINYYDTAWGYHEQGSEPFAGHALRNYNRSSFYLASKMPIWLAQTPDDVHRIFDEQLEKCQTDYFDFYLMHSIDKARVEMTARLGAHEILMKKKEEGLIKSLGFSFHDSPQVLQQYVDAYQWDFAQIQLNYMDWEMQDAKTQYDILTKANLQVAVMEPVRGGMLATLSPAAVEILKAYNPDASPASWALRYAASLPNVYTVLSGMSNMEQLKDNINTMKDFSPLSDEERNVLAEALTAYNQSGTVPCTGCAYCMDCPFGVDIPKVFAGYNQYRINENRWAWKNTMTILGDAGPQSCTSCGNCLPLCPQQIEIPTLMGEIDQQYQQSQK